MVMTFDYYYGAQAEQFNFIRIPKSMIVDPMFADLSVNAKLLYGVLLDRMNLSMKNRWFDSENRVYIIYQIAEIMEDFNFSKKTAVRYLNELEDFVACDGYDAMKYLLFCPSYPWHITEYERHLTEEKIEEILNRYVSVLTDTPPDIGYQSVENGG